MLQTTGLLYEGKAKKLYETEHPNRLLMEFKDDATAFDGEKFDQFENKGQINKELTLRLFKQLEQAGIPTHFIEDVDETKMIVRYLDIVPVEVVIRNRTAGSLAKRIGQEEGIDLARPIIEFFYKSDELGDPMITEEHIDLLELAEPQELEVMSDYAFRINTILKDFFQKIDIDLVDFKLEFGRVQPDGKEIVLADEITPDTCRLWDAESGKKLDKDRFRQDLGELIEGYMEVLGRVEHAV